MRILHLCLLPISILLSANSTLAQPTPDNFNFLFENNYNNDATGQYVPSEFVADWNVAAGSRPNGDVEIITDDAAHQKAMRAYYPQGTIGPSATHGFTWYSYFGTRGEEIYFSYDIRFKPGFEWVHGGKIPGIVGGSVTSGQAPTSTSGFSARMMWKGGGALVFYIYHPDQPGTVGETMEWEGFHFQTGKWYNLTIRVVLNSIVNSVAQRNGILEGYVDGKLVFQKSDFRFRLNSTIKIDKMYICSFFGGSSVEWEALRDEWIDMDNFVAYTYSSTAINVPIGLQRNTSGILLHPYFGSTSSSPLPPTAPTSLATTSASGNSVSLKWTDNSTNESGYKLERKTGSGSYTEVAQIAQNATTYTNTGLTAGTSYTYKVYAFNTTGNSACSNEISVTTSSGQNQPSTNVAAGKPSVQSATAYNGIASRANDNNTSGAWSAGSVSNTGNASKPYWQVDLQNNYYISSVDVWNRTDACCSSRLNNFYVFVSDNPFTSADPLITKSQAGVWSALITQVPSPNRILAVNRTGRYVRVQLAGQGELSLAEVKVSGITVATIPAPAAPQNLTTTGLSESSVKLDWTDNSSNETGFRIERKTGTGSFTQVAQLSSNCSTYTDNSLAGSTSYTYRIFAFNNTGNSVYSNQSTIVTPAVVLINMAPGKPSKQSATAYGGVASRANDNNVTGLWTAGSVSNTGSVTRPYWEVDLLASYPIDKIEIWNRTDNCCKINLSNFYVFVSNIPFPSTDPLTTVNQTGVWSKFTTASPVPSASMDVDRTGRYVRVQLANSGELSLAEVKVFANNLKSTQIINSEVPAEPLKISVYPNPSHGQVNISFDLESESQGYLGVFDMKGSMLHKIADGTFSQGVNHYTWDHSGTNGSIMPGIYIIKLNAGSHSAVVKIMINK